ncbi:MAG: carboxypeptidase regulatory-like domain-containing protein [Vicinamibacterales bacterium]
MQRRRFPVLLVFLCVVFLPGFVWAQASIIGSVRDESGGALPGVTVEAASPSLIEGTKSAMTDVQGRYRFEALRPGPYTLKFTLVGFDTLNRTGVEVPSDVVVTVNIEMKVGTLEESVTVTGVSPQVDVSQASRTQVLTREVIDALPVSRNVMSIGVLAPGVRPGTPDIGGSRMTEQVGLRAHGLGGNDAEQLVKGCRFKASRGPRSRTSTTCCNRKSP